ncbi:MAG: pirin family protein [Cyanobacteria bacterium]|nr:pirin family protein [Cyanobacteriota bacterium]
MATSDGAGVRMTRLLGTDQLQRLDPFLLLDMFHSDQPQDYIAGFPDHPHRGFETVTYMLAGRVRHEDNKGHVGVIEPGGVQWMTAGRGIVHAEMPEQDQGLMWGFQLWLNLPAARKMTEPRYQEFDPSEIPIEQRPDGTTVRVIAGETHWGTRGPIQPGETEALYWDVAIAPKQTFTEPLPPTHNGCLVVYDGQVTVHGDTSTPAQRVQSGELAVLGSGQQLQVRAGSEAGKFLLIAGQPLNEPVAQMGPFVMNTQAELMQAYRDYQAGRF